MRKAEIVRQIAEETGLTLTKSEEAVEAVLATVKHVLSRGESVTLRRFGSFEVRGKRARQGRNPKTGALAPIHARQVVRFKAGNQLKAMTNEAPTTDEVMAR